MNNYDKVAADSKKNFLKWNQEELIAKTKVDNDEEYIYLNFCNSPYRVDRKTGSVQRLENGLPVYEAGYNEVMGIFDYLCYSKDGAVSAEKWVSATALANNIPGKPGSLFPHEAVFLDENFDKLREFVAQYPGFSIGDATCILPIFDTLSVVFQFWRSDDEFPPSISFLWDGNTLNFLHFETAMFVQCHWIEEIIKYIKGDKE